MVMSRWWSPYAKNCISYIDVLKQATLVALRHELSSVKVKAVGEPPSTTIVTLIEDLIAL